MQSTLYLTGAQALKLEELVAAQPDVGSMVIVQEDLMQGTLERQGWIAVEFNMMAPATIIDRKGEVQ